MLVLFFAAGCAGHAPAPYQQLNAAVECGDPPKSVAVLPFINHTDIEGIENEFRLSVFGHIAVQAYRDVELSEVDSRLRDNGLLKDHGFTQVSIRELGRILQCDAVVMGKVLDFDRIFLGIYSQMSIRGSVTVWDTRSGTKIWTDEQSSRMHEGGVPLSLLDVPLISVRSGYNLMEENREDIVDDLSEQLISRMPAPACFLTVDIARVRYAYELQAGAYLVREHAQKLKKYLEEKGYSARIRSNWDDRGLWHRVFLGSYEDKEVALRLQKEIREHIGAQPIIARVVLNDSPSN